MSDAPSKTSHRAQQIGSSLYQRFIAREPDGDLQRRVWDPTPWMFDAYTGDDRRRHAMRVWCYATFGPPTWPFGDDPRPGRWHEGSATVFGWTWFGFSTLAEAAEFEEAWPVPAELASELHVRKERETARHTNNPEPNK